MIAPSGDARDSSFFLLRSSCRGETFSASLLFRRRCLRSLVGRRCSVVLTMAEVRSVFTTGDKTGVDPEFTSASWALSSSHGGLFAAWFFPQGKGWVQRTIFSRQPLQKALWASFGWTCVPTTGAGINRLVYGRMDTNDTMQSSRSIKLAPAVSMLYYEYASRPCTAVPQCLARDDCLHQALSSSMAKVALL